MAIKTNLIATLKTANDKTKTANITNVNPAAADSSLATFASSLFSLSKNSLVDVSVAEKRSLDMPDPTPAKSTPVLCLTAENPDLFMDDYDGGNDEHANQVLSEFGFGRSDTNVITLPILETNGGEFTLLVVAYDELDAEHPAFSYDGNNFDHVEGGFTEYEDEDTGETYTEQILGEDIEQFVTVSNDRNDAVTLTFNVEDCSELGQEYLDELQRGFALSVNTGETDKYLAAEKTFIIKVVPPAVE